MFTRCISGQALLSANRTGKRKAGKGQIGRNIEVETYRRMIYSRVSNELKVPLHLATARGLLNIRWMFVWQRSKRSGDLIPRPKWRNLPRNRMVPLEKLSHAPLLCSGVFESAVSNAEDAKKEWLMAALEEGQEIPAPDGLNDYSG